MIKSTLCFLLTLTLLGGCSGDKSARLKMGDPAPDFLIEDLKGKSHRLSDFKGLPVVIRFFVTDCKFCKADTPIFNDYYNKYQDQGLKVLYLTTTVDRTKVEKFAADLQIPFPVAIDYNKTVTKLYNVKVEPQTIILNSEHLIKGAILGGVTEPELDEILAADLKLSSAEGVVADPRDNVKADSRCPVCGMFVAKFDVWITQIHYDEDTVLYFDGVKDMMAYYHSPTSFAGRDQREIEAIWVKDYYSLKWIDARQAFFVVGSDVHGPMGNEFIPFAGKAAAEAFLADHLGRQVMSFEEITAEQAEKLRVGNKMKNMK